MAKQPTKADQDEIKQIRADLNMLINALHKMSSAIGLPKSILPPMPEVKSAKEDKEAA